MGPRANTPRAGRRGGYLWESANGKGEILILSEAKTENAWEGLNKTTELAKKGGNLRLGKDHQEIPGIYKKKVGRT